MKLSNSFLKTIFFILNLILLQKRVLSDSTHPITQLITINGSFQHNHFLTYINTFLTEKHQQQQNTQPQEYKIISVLGTQSSGKSTLLNRLFQTDFTTKRASENDRSTEGIWASFIPSNNILVLDTEGSNSPERFLAHDNQFENKIIHYSALVSNIYLINLKTEQIIVMNEQSKGNSKNQAIRNIFKNLIASFVDFNLDRVLDQHQILFVLRDFNSSIHSKKDIQQIIRDKFIMMWESTYVKTHYDFELGDKLAAFVSSFQYAFMPHFKKQAEEFNQEVQKLRKFFNEDTALVSKFNSSQELVDTLQKQWKNVTTHTFCSLDLSSDERTDL